MRFLPSFFLLFSLPLIAADVSGTWEGRLRMVQSTAWIASSPSDWHPVGCVSARCGLPGAASFRQSQPAQATSGSASFPCHLPSAWDTLLWEQR